MSIWRRFDSQLFFVSQNLTVAVGGVGGRAGQTGSRDVDPSYHAWLFVCQLLILFVLLFLLPAVPHAAFWWILVGALEAGLIEGDLQLKDVQKKWVWSPAVLFKHLYLRIFKLLKYKVLCCKSTWSYMYVSCWVKHTCMTIIKELSSCLLTWCFCEDMMWNVQLCPTISCNKYKESFQKFPDLDQEHLHKLISSKLE